MRHPLVHKAAAFAAAAHAGVARRWSGEPYFRHVKRVARRLEKLGFSPEVVAAAYLHDVVEDSGVSVEALEKHFGARVAGLVAAVSKPVVAGDRSKRVAAEVAHLSAASYAAASIKLSDMLDNASSVAKLAPEFAAVYLPELRRKAAVVKHGHPALVKELRAILAK
jgi:(p)ppGpp synthase/HD superfamily hydrolase